VDFSTSQKAQLWEHLRLSYKKVKNNLIQMGKIKNNANNLQDLLGGGI
jgi:hypothetical protein